MKTKKVKHVPRTLVHGPLRYDRVAAKHQRMMLDEAIRFVKGTSHFKEAEPLEGALEFLHCFEDELVILFGEPDEKNPIVEITIGRYG